MRESYLEQALRRRVRAMGGLTEKLVPASHSGVPDDLVLLPGGRLYLVELKAPGGRLRPIQQVWHQRARALGHSPAVLTGPEELDAWLRAVEKTLP